MRTTFYPVPQLTRGAISIFSPDYANRLKVYLAGKIGHNDWRSQVTAGVKANMEDEALNPAIAFAVPYATLNGYAWTGPYAIACDHGCAHGPSTHGAAITVCATEHYTTLRARRDLVHRLNISRLERATGVFAYIDELDCFGTLAEIGHAYGKGIPVGLCYGPRITVHERDNLWFVERYATWIYDGPPLKAAFSGFMWELNNWAYQQKEQAKQNRRQPMREQK